MQMFSGILLVAILFTLVALGAQWWRTTEDLNVSRRTIEGYLTLIEGSLRLPCRQRISVADIVYAVDLVSSESASRQR